MNAEMQDDSQSAEKRIIGPCVHPMEPLVAPSGICATIDPSRSTSQADELAKTLDEDALTEIYLQIKGERRSSYPFIIACSAILFVSCSLLLVVHSRHYTILTFMVEQESTNAPAIQSNPTWPIHEHSDEYPLTTFHCLRGYIDYPNEFLSGVFPEYTRHVNLRNMSRPPEASSEYDLAIFGKHRGKKKTCSMQEWIEKDFKGKLIYFDSESLNHGGADVDMRGADSYEIGPRADSIRSLRVPFAVQYLGMMGPSRNGTNLNLYNPDLKPRSSGVSFLIYANSNSILYRDWAFHNLSSIDTVHYAGKCNGVENRTTNAIPIDNGKGKNYLLYRDYRFCLVMENVKEQGYITEKIIDAFLGGCIPIYYGTEEIFDIFNDAAFIYYDVENSQPALERVAYLEANRTAYEEVLAAPILANNQETLEEYFSYSDAIGGGKLKYRIRHMLGMP